MVRVEVSLTRLKRAVIIVYSYVVLDSDGLMIFGPVASKVVYLFFSSEPN